jgi:hypothetical protein
MSGQATEPMEEARNLPPLILHPFSGGSRPEDLVEGSRASLVLDGLLDSQENQPLLYRKMLLGRYYEVRMLLFLGKDVFRWLQQCVEQLRGSSDAEPQISDRGITEQSFAGLLVEEPPGAVKQKLESWGVSDRRAIFSRAIGIHSLFHDPPPPEVLSPIFLKNYHRFADHAYICFQHLRPFLALDPKEFPFEIYASEEYARLLSDQWQKT